MNSVGQFETGDSTFKNPNQESEITVCLKRIAGAKERLSEAINGIEGRLTPILNDPDSEPQNEKSDKPRRSPLGGSLDQIAEDLDFQAERIGLIISRLAL